VKASRQQQAQAVVDARIHGRREAARRHNVSIRTLDRWIARASAADPELASEVETLTVQVGEAWIAGASEAMTKGCEKFSQIVDAIDLEKVTARDARDLAEALQKVGELVIAHHMLLGDGGSENDTADNGASANAKGRARW
jgi:hypothetical protein